MPLLRGSRLFIVLIAVLSKLTGSARIGTDKRISINTDFTGVVLPASSTPFLFDVTEFWTAKPKNMTSGVGVGAWKCCCDKHKEKGHNKRGINDELRAGFCVITSDLGYTGGCGNVKVTETTKKAHNYKDTEGGICEVPRLGLEAFYREHGSADDYCKGGPIEVQLGNMTAMSFDMPSAHIDEMVDIPCLDGSPGVSFCRYNTPLSGRWSTVECDLGEAGWCPAHDFEEDGVAQVRAAQVGDMVEVKCGKSRAIPSNVVCDAMMGFSPTPECQG